MNAQTTKAAHLVSDSYRESIEYDFLNTRLENNLHTVAASVETTAKMVDMLAALIQLNCTIVQTDTHGGFAMCGDDAMIQFSAGKWSSEVKIFGDTLVVEKLQKALESRFPSNPCFIKWVYDPHHMEYMTVPVHNGNQPMQEMYPFLEGESLASYYDRYLNSSANILVLIGAPGTGKTTFVRGLLAHTKKSATLTYHQKILEQDSFFVQWIEGNDTFMILEDSDTLLLPRAEGNDMMARFLNLGDGLMSFTGKKIIFSTNIPNISDIDDALLRPGRCFDVIEFSALNRPQAEQLAAKVGVPLPDGNSFTVGEVFAATKNEVSPASRNKRFGFV